MPTLLLRVDGIDGPNAEATIQSLLERLPGVYAAQASAAHGRVELDYEDDEVGIDEILAVLRRSGYAARLGG
ncbi:MAG: heavy-metal-associated domain-containing protein [Longimicrobiales bacterium]